MRKGNSAPRAREGDPAEVEQHSHAVRNKVIELAGLLRSSEPEAVLTDEGLTVLARQVTDEDLSMIAHQVEDETLAAVVDQVSDADLVAIAGRATDEDLAAIAAEHAVGASPVQSADVLACLPAVEAGDTRRAYSERLLKAVRR
ncbi:hypothetical protein ACWEQC_21905 [Streptomyces shenzhenensis]